MHATGPVMPRRIRHRCPVLCPVFVIWVGRLDTWLSFYFSVSIGPLGTQSRYCPKGTNTPLPIFIDQTSHRPYTTDRGLLVSPRNLEDLRKQNADNARCVC